METKVANIDDLNDGEMKEVKVGERAVLLAKVGERFYATGAVCPHYGGPLPQGVLSERRVMCPWHQATFELETGALLEPPPLNGIPRFSVRVAGTDVYVNVPEDAPERVAMPMAGYDVQQDGRTFAIIGGGAGAAAAVETLRQAEFKGRILVISQEDRWPYDRPNCSKGYLSGAAPASWLQLRPSRFYEEHGIERRHDRVRVLDVKTRTIELESGETMTPDAVLIATGGVPRKLDVPGAELDGVRTLRSRADAEAIIAEAQTAKQAVVVGASFIAMEVTASLRERGLAVTVVAPATTPFERTLGPQVGEMLKALHERNGVAFSLGRSVRRFRGAGRVGRVELDDGSALPADMVVVGIGVRPATDFIEGVALNSDGSVDVDDQFRVVAPQNGEVQPGVWAAGDIARYPDPYSGLPVRIEHWRTALQHGRAAARSMAGRGQPYRGVPFFWSLQHGVSVKYVGHAQTWDELLLTGDIDHKFMAYYVKDNRLVAAVGTMSLIVAAFAELMRLGRLPTAEEVRGKPPQTLVDVLKSARAH